MGDTEAGRSLRDGLSPSVEPASSLAGSAASIPSAGEWLIINDWDLRIRQIDKITPKLFKLGAGTSRYPTQIGRDDKKIVAVFPDQPSAEAARSAIAGVLGEYRRRCRTAQAVYDDAVNAARIARDRQTKRVVAQAIEARRAETGTGSVHESAVGNADAPNDGSARTKEAEANHG